MGEAADDKATESWTRPCLTGKGWLRIQTEMGAERLSLTMSIFILKSSRGNAAGGLSKGCPGTRQVGGDESRVSKCILVTL